MRVFHIALAVLAMESAHGGTLHSEAVSLLERLSSQGYTCVALADMRLDLLEPCTVSVYPPEGTCSDGYYAALGGNNILDLGLRLEGEGWFLEDSLPDDIPVLRVDSAEIAGSRRLIVCAWDMIRGFRTDSTVVIWAFAPVDPNM
ncbi:MAG: hypothetical protein JXA64_06920 [Candidatus Fermentibacteraceae bacterium]|nr:hypothetical protein [Candidatus Fermentibacteraceae bacterium]MBN2608831.1 hypothetical protein [Candidatus Fermentibacteraceae bacterium]